MDEFFQFDWSFIDRIGDNPFEAMLFFFTHGGWFLVAYVIVWGALKVWQVSRQVKFNAKKTFIVLAVDIPRMHEQGPRAVDNMFAYLAGAHSSNSWTEDWFVGRTQDLISCELISIDGHVQYIIHTTTPLRDLVESAIYAQYPDAEITQVEDYATKVPQHYPDNEWDLWGVELIPTKSDVYPLKTYPFFEDKVSGEFKDPMSAMLESLSLLKKGEQAWFQIVLTPIAQGDFHKKGEEAVKKMLGRETPAKKTALDHAIDFPLHALGTVADHLLGSGHEEAPKKKEGPTQPKIMSLTESEKEVIHGIENKISKIGYLCKIRFVYIAKKTVMSKPRVINPFIGAIKQFNTNNMLSLKPEMKKVGVSGALWWFKASRNNHRKNHLLSAYRRRSNWAGTPNFYLCTEELASLWHFPHSMQVKSPSLKKTETKRSEPPQNLPFE